MIKLKKIVLSAFACLFLLEASAQTDYGWWNEKHDWDGKTSWIEYLTMSAAMLGPNALPVPVLYNGKIPSDHSFTSGMEGHYSTGDQTTNLYLDYTFPLFSDRASIQVTYRPIEFYQTDTLTRDLRKSRQYDPKGYSLGDVYVSTYIQLLKEKGKQPDLSVSFNTKTASGTNLDGARNTDSPGYWFDLTMGKTIFSKDQGILNSLKIYGRIGFYAYQTHTVNNPQNDAIVYGAGIETSFLRLNIHNQLTGYHGYFDNGDRPMVYRLWIEPETSRRNSYRIILQKGLHDFPYTSLNVVYHRSLCKGKS